MKPDPTVFVVDDDKAVRESLVLLLKVEGLVVEAFASGEEFIEACKKDRPGCLVLDISMPGMNGLELQEALAKKQIRIPIIFVTGHGDVPMSVRALKAGAFDFIEKPFENNLLLSRIRAALAWDLNIREEEARKVAAAVSIYAESIVETVREPLIVLDENLNLISANRSFYQTFKIPVPESEGPILLKFQESLWRIPGLKEKIEEVILNKIELRDFEEKLVLPEFGSRILRFNARELQQNNSVSKRILLAIEDITKRKLAEEESNAILEAAPDAIIAVNQQGEITLVNEQTENLFGYTRAGLIGQKLEILIPQHLRKEHEKQRKIYFRNPERRPMGSVSELYGLRKDGTQFPIGVRLSPFQSENELLVLSSIRDITQRKQMEDALFEEKERALVTLRSIGEAVITTDAEGIVEFLNPNAEALTGWSSSEAKGQVLDNIFNIVDERSRLPAVNPVSRCLQLGEAIGQESNTALISREGNEICIESSAAPIQYKEGKILGAVMVFKDVTQQREMVKEMAHHALHDPLTGLVNRREFEKRLEHAVASSLEQGNRHALCYIDLDQFKIVNDLAGHAAGDELLRQIADIFQDKLRDRDTLARLGGDEFGLLLDNCRVEKAFEIAQALVVEVRNYRFVWEGQLFQIGASVGLVAITGEVDSAVEMLKQADVACYVAKESGRNQVHIYEAEESALAQHHIEMLHAADLTSALEDGRFRLYCQPIVALAHDVDEFEHHEILVRLLDKNGALVLPGAFIPVAERHGIMGAIDRRVIDTVFHHYMHYYGSSLDGEIAINLSGNSLNDDTLIDFVREQFNKTKMPPSKVCFELTETVAIHNLNKTKIFMNNMKKLGCQFALDNFGSGLSSFAYLKKLPIDYVKIDGSIIREMLENIVDGEIVKAINQIGHSMGVRIVAEHAETQFVVEKLKELGVDFAQGFAVSRPLPLEQVMCNEFFV